MPHAPTPAPSQRQHEFSGQRQTGSAPASSGLSKPNLRVSGQRQDKARESQSTEAKKKPSEQPRPAPIVRNAPEGCSNASLPEPG